MWDDYFKDEEKCRVSFSISLYNKEHTFSGTYEDDATWIEVLNDVVKTLEASYGYSFDLPEELGVYYREKEKNVDNL